MDKLDLGPDVKPPTVDKQLKDMDLYVILPETDTAKELERLENEFSRINIGMNKLNKKLANKYFIERAPKLIVAGVASALVSLQEQHSKTITRYYRIRDYAIEAGQAEKN